MLKISSRRDPVTAAVELKVEGALDLATRSELEHAVMTAVDSGTHLLSLDLSEVNYLGSVALAVVVNAAKTLKRRGGELKIATKSEQARRHLQLLNLESLLQEKREEG